MPDGVELGPDARPSADVRRTRRFTLAGRGLHQADNATRVWAVVEAARSRPGRGRARAGALRDSRRAAASCCEQGGLTILNDCYNANPQSFRAAIATARALRGRRRLVFVAGTMRELGAEAAALHAEVARRAGRARARPAGRGRGLRSGPRARTLTGWARGSSPRPIRSRSGPLVASRLHGEEVVVLKASRGVALERILPALTVRATPPR